MFNEKCYQDKWLSRVNTLNMKIKHFKEKIVIAQCVVLEWYNIFDFGAILSTISPTTNTRNNNVSKCTRIYHIGANNYILATYAIHTWLNLSLRINIHIQKHTKLSLLKWLWNKSTLPLLLIRLSYLHSRKQNWNINISP